MNERQTPWVVYLFWLFSVCLLSCNKDEIVDPGNYNSPSYVSSPNGFSYFVNARNLTLDQTMPLTFTSDSLSYALSVAGYSYGLASITVRGDSASFRSSDLIFNTNQTLRFSLGCPPKSVTMKFSRFSGQLAFALGGIPNHTTKVVHYRPNQEHL